MVFYGTVLEKEENYNFCLGCQDFDGSHKIIHSNFPKNIEKIFKILKQTSNNLKKYWKHRVILLKFVRKFVKTLKEKNFDSIWSKILITFGKNFYEMLRNFWKMMEKLWSNLRK